MRVTLPGIAAVVCSPVAAPRSHRGRLSGPVGLGWLSGAHRATGTGFRVIGRALMGRRIEPCLVSGMPPLVLASASPLVGETEAAFHGRVSV